MSGLSSGRPLRAAVSAALLGLGVATAALAAAAGTAPRGTSPGEDSPPLTLEQIMADPAWIGFPVQSAYWSSDGHAVYYSIKRASSTVNDLHRIDLPSGADRLVEGIATATAETDAVYDAAGKRAAFVRNGDLFLRTVGSKDITQITRGVAGVTAPRFSADGRLLEFRSGNDWFIHDFKSGLTSSAAVLRAEKSPDAAPAPDDLRDTQLRIFSTLKRLQDQKDFARKYAEDQERLDPTRAASPYYLGDDVKIRDTELSPNGRWLLVITEPRTFEKGRVGKLTRYVTNSGYEEFEDERLRVGRNPPPPQSLLLIDLAAHTAHALDVGVLPGIHDDPLQSVRAENRASAPASAPRRHRRRHRRRAR